MKAKKPKDCATVEEIRAEIDNIDKRIISLFSDRHKYVEEIVKYKHDEAGVVAQERKDHVIAQRRKWAAENGLNPDTFEKIYTLLVESNIEHEMEIFKSKTKK
jgi:isochorismate pyruvate lyase